MIGFGQDSTNSSALSGKVYVDRGILKGGVNDYSGVIADCTEAIRLDPEYADAYLGRGFIKAQVELPYCRDFKKACDLGNAKGCEYYADCK